MRESNMFENKIRLFLDIITRHIDIGMIYDLYYHVKVVLLFKLFEYEYIFSMLIQKLQLQPSMH